MLLVKDGRVKKEEAHKARGKNAWTPKGMLAVELLGPWFTWNLGISLASPWPCSQPHMLPFLQSLLRTVGTDRESQWDLKLSRTQLHEWSPEQRELHSHLGTRPKLRGKVTGSWQ